MDMIIAIRCDKCSDSETYVEDGQLDDYREGIELTEQLLELEIRDLCVRHITSEE